MDVALARSYSPLPSSRGRGRGPLDLALPSTAGMPLRVQFLEEVEQGDRAAEEPERRHGADPGERQAQGGEEAERSAA